MILIISGPQGSGKGTQAELIAYKLSLFHMESGEMLRKMALTDSRIRKMQDEGIIVPDKETLSYIDGYISEHHGKFEELIFDGYPRNINQYELMKKWLDSRSTKIDNLLYLQISDDVAVERLSARRVCDKCKEVYNLVTNPPPKSGCKCGGKLIQRHDDNPVAIKKRLKVYHQQTEPMLSVVRKDTILIEIDGERPIDVIFKDILKKLGKDGKK